MLQCPHCKFFNHCFQNAVFDKKKKESKGKYIFPLRKLHGNEKARKSEQSKECQNLISCCSLAVDSSFHMLF